MFIQILVKPKKRFIWTRLKRWVILFLIFCLGNIIVFKGISFNQIVALEPPNTPIPASLFGMHIHRITKTTPWPVIPFATWRLWDAYVAWPNLEPKKDEWHFELLDKYVSLASKHHVEVLLPLGLSPAWASARPTEPSAYSPGFAAEPRDIENWRNYVRTVATRYKGRIHYYEIWNEPNLRKFYSGTVGQMERLAREAYLILKQIDPSIVVVSPAATGDGTGPSWLERYLSKGGGKYADVVGYHFYVVPHPPETIVPLVRKVQPIMAKNGIGNKPLWNTEAGWVIAGSRGSVDPKRVGFSEKTNVLNADEAAAYVARSFILGWATGLKRFYWYAWDNQAMGLTEVDGTTIKPPAIAYAETQKWLVGAKMTECKSDSEETWTCQLTRSGDYTAWIVWNPKRKLTFKVPRAWRIHQVKNLTGNRRKLANLKRLKIGHSPLLLERSVL
jgi:hypothetical protein